MNRRTRQIVPDRLQQHLYPATRRRNPRPRRTRKVMRQRPCGTPRHREARPRRPGIRENPAPLAAPVAETVMPAGRLGLDRNRTTGFVKTAPAAAHHTQQNALGLRLADRQATVDRYILNTAPLPPRTRPGHLDGPNDPVFPETEMQDRRGLRQVARPQTDLLDLPARRRVHRHTRPDPLPVVKAARQRHRKPAMAVVDRIAVNGGRRPVVGDEDVHAAVAVIVRAHDAAPLAPMLDPQLRAPLRKRPVAVRHEQTRTVRLEFDHRGRVPPFSRIDAHEPAIGVEDVGMAVIVEIRKTRPPGPAALAHAGLFRRVLELPAEIPV